MWLELVARVRVGVRYSVKYIADTVMVRVRARLSW